MGVLKNWKWSIVLLSLVLAAAAGCGSDSSLSAAQEQAIRHPVADPNHQAPTKANMDKMSQQIAAYRQAHANDKPVQFTK